LTAAPGNNKVVLTWNDLSGSGETYTVYRGTASGGPYGTTVASGVASNTYTDSTAVNGTTYYYVVKAMICTSVISAANSNQVSALPAVPDVCASASRLVECNSSNQFGDVCGGGYLFCKSGTANCGNANLVASPAFTSGEACSTGLDGLNKAWESPNDNVIESGNYAATDLYTGYNNLNGNASKTAANYAPSAKYVAAKYCADLVMNGFSDWYLPSSSEMCAMVRSGNYCQSILYGCVAGSGEAGATAALNSCTNAAPLIKGFTNANPYWQSTEFDNSYVKYIDATSGEMMSSDKSNSFRVRCVRRF